eukprot:CAMPEP_0117035832 /NCGR_PEP_ID=MMETSP0472-20121206/25425_1 /TAXON_ID=693140 ORGANISM="Tiarina fusus, Strain LIS" /NCGR_SAMPLE_ID=MMETSP0472 /ASSEMBLY_ACC=CAM_ASM_000603 /LENGTH=845 /DNA_ID=CAMNT_0004745421 /DNA_START=25 /DNA_END=2562 /DNA_ORIENTATION=+
MASWSHFLSGHDTVNADNRTDKLQCFRTGLSASFDTSTSAVSVVLPQKFGASIDSTLLRSLSSSSLQGMSHNPSDASAGCLQGEGSLEGSFGTSEQQANPRRNLTEAFEELYIKPSIDTGAAVEEKGDNKGSGMASMISPTGVADFPSASQALTPEKGNVETQASGSTVVLPHFELHPSLKKDLSSALVDRVSFYAVIHDINKEATAMASNDESGYSRNPEELREAYDPLVVAVNGYPNAPLQKSHSMIDAAVIDEEKWLLEAIDSNRTDESRSVKACPPTFLQAMGERDYENPLTSLSNGSRTQLWKPSRSWWEAKSGKNPWIEPKSHNKRWRYLWPLIHYHKFLARCIKKLKRNGVDVKTSVSPVSVFLREEVCAVSDHLASVSLFDSDQWMVCLQEFHGWTESGGEAEEHIRGLVSKLNLRSLHEPGDVDSPLLRSQIDEQYLRAMASARAQMAGTGNQGEKRGQRETSSNRAALHETKPAPGFDPSSAQGHPPMYPRHAASPGFGSQARLNGMAHAGMRRSRYGYPPQPGGQWWGHNWNANGPYPYGDDASVHSALSGESYSHHHFEMQGFHGGMAPHYYHPMMYPQHPMPVGMPPAGFDPNVPDPSLFPMDGYIADHTVPNGWFSSAHGNGVPPSPSEMGMVPSTPSGAATSHEMPPTGLPNGDPAQHACDHTPYKYNPSQVPMSPYWGHLDHATLAMMGIATPQAPSAPQTPARSSNRADVANGGQSDQSNPVAINAQPLLLRQQYYGYGYANREGYGPPSPATQFMMSPQANFSYNYGYGFSPARRPTTNKRSKSPKDAKGTRRSDSAQASMTPPRVDTDKRESPATVVTTTESESLS